MRIQSTLLLLSVLLAVALADIYMHSPPGSNDRNQEEGVNRDNAQRLFNSQNNDKGGYCRGGILKWYEKSYLPIEWTAQHGCGSNQVDCNVILQYMCGPNTAEPLEVIRDGTSTTTIPNNAANAVTMNGNSNDYLYGMHESYYYYQNCTTRSRNKGLFTANQNLNGRETARFTRQQPGGTQYGFECPEERDYYPYWAPSPWKDIAIFTGDTSNCKMYKAESQNVKSKYYCVGVAAPIPIQEQDCTSKGGKWVEQKSHGIGAPECRKAEWSHVNHLGLAMADGRFTTYNWSLPHQGMEPCIKAGTCNCILRVRYNISNAEVQSWGSGAYDSRNNGNNSPIKTDPNVLVQGKNLTLNVNEQQYGRTFQDRSHVFSIIARPSNLKDAKIWNLLVKGKRGNVVQSFPAMEYQFTPNQIHMRKGEYVHFQWTGCDHNPQNYAGNGRNGLDRSNLVQIHSLSNARPFKDEDYTSKNALFTDSKTRLRFAQLDQVGCKSYEQLVADNNGDANAIEQDPQNCAFLNAASNTFDGGVHKMDRTGDYYFMSTRNHDFSNRDQKGAIHVDPLLKPWQIALIAVGCTLFVGLATAGGSVAYAKTHPHSAANRFFSRVPGVKKVVA